MLSGVSFRATAAENPAKAPRFSGRYWLDTEFIDAGDKIDLISIGMVAEDGREFHAVSTDFDETKAKAVPWIRDNVLDKLAGLPRQSREQIKNALLQFIGNDKTPEFWAYNGAYDHVALCQLFGGMMKLRQHFESADFFDVKQLAHWLGKLKLPPNGPNAHHALDDAKWDRQVWLQLMKLAGKPVN
jgi:hypothetical protein